LRRVCALAEELRPSVASDERFARLRPRALPPGGCLELADFTDVYLTDRAAEVYFLQQRARLRAGDGDLVVAHRDPAPAWEEYCQTRLGLGYPEWLRPLPDRPPVRLAAACWIDREVRGRVVRALRQERLRYLQPYHGSRSVWQLAWLLQRSSRRPLHVLAPPPRLSRLVNDKLWFCHAVESLLGPSAVPTTREAGNLATLALVARSLARRSQRIVVKRPDAAGGEGNLVVESSRLADKSLGEIRRHFRARLGDIGWTGSSPLLVSSWETEVLSSPSTQFWIPPREQEEPVVEGVYEQVLSGTSGIFEGCRPAELPSDLTQEMVDRSYLLARLFQELGYVGRCSIDLLLVGPDLESARIELIECNGRWGGTSIPMTLANRLLGDWSRRPYFARELAVPGLCGVPTREVLACLEDDLFDVRTGRGHFVVFNPGRRDFRPAVAVLAFGESQREAERLVMEDATERLQSLALRAGAQIGQTLASTSGATTRIEPSGTSSHSSWEIGSEATTTAR
jgi:hypothetical protein